MNNLNFNDLPKDMQEELTMEMSSRCQGQYEEQSLTEAYQPLIDHYERVEQRNKAIIAGDLELLKQLEDEMFGDVL